MKKVKLMMNLFYVVLKIDHAVTEIFLKTENAIVLWHHKNLIKYLSGK